MTGVRPSPAGGLRAASGSKARLSPQENPPAARYARGVDFTREVAPEDRVRSIRDVEDSETMRAERDRRGGVELGANGILTKRFERRDLIELARDLIAQLAGEA